MIFLGKKLTNTSEKGGTSLTLSATSILIFAFIPMFTNLPKIIDNIAARTLCKAKIIIVLPPIDLNFSELSKDATVVIIENNNSGITNACNKLANTRPNIAT